MHNTDFLAFLAKMISHSRVDVGLSSAPVELVGFPTLVSQVAPFVFLACSWIFLSNSACFFLACSNLATLSSLSLSISFSLCLASRSACILLWAITCVNNSTASLVTMSLLSLRANCMSFGISITHFAWNVHNWLSSRRPMR